MSCVVKSDFGKVGGCEINVPPACDGFGVGWFSEVVFNDEIVLCRRVAELSVPVVVALFELLKRLAGVFIDVKCSVSCWGLRGAEYGLVCDDTCLVDGDGVVFEVDVFPLEATEFTPS